MKRNVIHGYARGSLTLDVREDEWSARITTALDETDPALLLSLPRGLFQAHDREMRRAGACAGTALDSDTEYLSTVWGFTRADGDGVSEIAEVPLVTVRVSGNRLAVDVADFPWLIGRAPLALPEEWRRPGDDRWCLLGICFDVDLDASDAEERFLSELAAGDAALGEVNIVTKL
ncbi:hypothetical protein [Streptomyces sp. TP-A0356]|uniref:hypothetical protein n=1 Tax=Streptomyces sp. TP-A0356 TaxID=1359208 RepID=UPI0006E42A4D|nr:hypothetical protein [Streptomyces sp. TP-A0356]